MPVHRADVLVVDPYPVFTWIKERIPGKQVVRQMAYKVPGGWYIKCAFKRQDDAEAFLRYWAPHSLSAADVLRALSDSSRSSWLPSGLRG